MAAGVHLEDGGHLPRRSAEDVDGLTKGLELESFRPARTNAAQMRHRSTNRSVNILPYAIMVMIISAIAGLIP